MFVRLGLTNTWRQLGRSLLVLVATTLSAMSLTSALSYSQGNTKESYQFYRELLGGEILVSPVHWAGQQVSDITGDEALRSLRLPKTGLSWLEAYYPELYDDGFLGTSDTSTAQVISADDLQQLASETGISGYRLQYQFPASLSNGTKQTEKYISVTVLPIPQSGKLPGLPDMDWSPYIESGQPFALLNSRLNVSDTVLERLAQAMPDSAVVTGFEEITPTPDQIYEMKLSKARQTALADMQLPTENESAKLRIPLLRSTGDGEYLPDYSQVFTVEVPVVSQISMPTRSITFTNDLGSFVTETAYLHGGYVWLPQTLWQELWQQASAGGNPAQSNLALQVDNMDLLAHTVAYLQEKYPQFTFVSVADFAYRMENGVIIDRFYRVPDYLYQPGETKLAVPVDLSKLMGVLFYLIAGMLIASRMLTGAAARRTEIGVLKALGARRRDITAMVLTESLVVTAIGTTIGFLLVRIGNVIIELGNDMPWQTILSRTCSEYVMVAGLAGAVSLLFSLLPALRMSNLTVMGVLRGE